MADFNNPTSYPKSLREYISRMDDFIYSTSTKYMNELDHKIKKQIQLGEKNLVAVFKGIYSDLKNKSERGYYAEATFRAYRAYFIHGLAVKLIEVEKGLVSDTDVDLGFDEYFLEDLYKKAIDINFVLDTNKPKRTSELKAKYFEKTFYNYLMRQFELKKISGMRVGQFDELIVAFVAANLVVGLRPVEWFSVSFCCALNGPKLIMIVPNGKATHGRANGKERYLILDALNQEDIDKIERYFILLDAYMINFLKKKGKGNIFHWEDKQTYIKVLGDKLRVTYADFLKHLNKEPKNILRPTLYSTRHQCIANAKVKGVDKYVIAGAFGHASKETAANHYGRKWRGYAGFNIQPTLDTIQNVNGGHEYIKTLLANELDTPYYFDLNMAKDFNSDYHIKKLNSGLAID